MQVRVYTSKFKNLAVQALEYASKEISLPKNLIIYIGKNKSKKYGGSCINNIVYINEYYCHSKELFARCLFHELIHAKQYHTSQLELIDGAEAWNGKPCDSWKNESLSPWEIEATIKSKQMFENFSKKPLV